MSLKELRDLVSWWQEELKLPEWDIRVGWMSKANIKEYQKCDGLCDWEGQYKVANLWVRRGSVGIPHTVVHELLHIRLEGCKPFDERNTTDEWEFSLNTLSTVITGVKL